MGGNGFCEIPTALYTALFRSRSEEPIFPSSSVDDKSRSEDLIREKDVLNVQRALCRCEKELLY